MWEFVIVVMMFWSITLWVFALFAK